MTQLTIDSRGSGIVTFFSSVPLATLRGKKLHTRAVAVCFVKGTADPSGSCTSAVGMLVNRVTLITKLPTAGRDPDVLITGTVTHHYKNEI